MCVAMLDAPIRSSRPGSASPAPQALEANMPVVAAAMTMLCSNSATSRGKDGGINGCTGCPNGTDFQGGEIDSWALYGINEGHFTSPQDDVLILDGAGCDSHAQNWGGSLVFTVTAGQPKLLRYDKGLRTNQCTKLSYANGQDFLVCRSGWGGQGEAYDNVMVSRFDATGKDKTADVLRTEDTTGTCAPNFDSTVIQMSGISAIHFTPRDSGVVTGMTVTVAYGKPTCAQYADAFDKKTTPAAVKPYQIEFTFDGKQFSVAAKSQALFNAHFAPEN
jgi:hypothetical protein